ncbi:hypothetical protein L7F22_049947 [Adiantum nelumboides]|nr:hypothetical protein [Adiantum nelumboides]MCO5595896.1 hypothetical protein [Adiantum nelumboides]
MGLGSGFDPHGTQDGGLFLVVVFSAVLAVCIGLSFKLSRRLSARGSRLPPGPPAWPVIGNFHLLGAMPHQSLTQLARRYGPLMSMRLGSILYIVASTPEMARYFLQTYDHCFASRPRTAAATHILNNSTDLAFAPYGPYWTLIRRACVKDVFHPKRLLSFQPIRQQETRNLIHGLLQQSSSGHPILLRPHLQGAANNIISRMTLSKTYIELSSSSSAGDIVAIIDEIMHLLGVPNVGDFIPSLAWLDLQGLERKMRAVREQVKVTLGEIIRERRDRNAEQDVAPADQPQDFLDALLSMQKSEREVEITDDNVTAVILDMYVGGTDTTSITSEWALAELLANPACLEKVQEELDRVVGRERPVEDGDIAQLPYLRAVVQETFRLHPAVPLLLPRQAMQACSVAGYDLPEDARVYVNVWAIGRDPGTWEEPLAFHPERFLGGTVEEKGKHFELLPFGSGRRRCVGYELGLLNVRLFLSSLLQSFHWQLPPGVKRPDFTEKFGLSVTLANCLAVQASPRLPIMSVFT